jgi:formate dehydrogenase major subunit
VVGERAEARVAMGRLSDAERVELLRGVEKAGRIARVLREMAERRQDFAEVEQELDEADARREAARCLQCDCLARDDCKLRRYASQYGAEATRLRGERRSFTRDDSHPLIVYESGKCILCGLCVRIAEQAGEALGMSFTSRGFAGRTAVPFGGCIAEGLSSETARRVAEACPTGALALKRPASPRLRSPAP